MPLYLGFTFDRVDAFRIAFWRPNLSYVQAYVHQRLTVHDVDAAISEAAAS